jgi:hypothetical protein
LNKEQATYVTPLGHILIVKQPIFALMPYCCMLGKEATNTNFIVWFDLPDSTMQSTAGSDVVLLVEYSEKTTDLPQVTDKLYLIIFY